MITDAMIIFQLKDCLQYYFQSKQMNRRYQNITHFEYLLFGSISWT